MNDGISISYVLSSFVELTRTCHQSCGYCSFHDAPLHSIDEGQDAPLRSIDEVRQEIQALAKRGATEVIFITGESPQEFPYIQITLSQDGFSSFSDYIEAICKIALKENLLPVLNTGHLDTSVFDRFAKIGCSVLFNFSTSAFTEPDHAHEQYLRRNTTNGKSSIKALRDAGIPYSLGIMIGTGETEKERLEFIENVRHFCFADPWLQDIKILPFQPSPGTFMFDRPPLPFDAVKRVTIAIREAFPTHHISIPPWLFSRFPELVEAGLNDLGSVPFFSDDPMHPSFEIPGFETLRSRLAEYNIRLYERETLSTVSALNRIEVIDLVTKTRALIEKRNSYAVNLIDNDHCFVCGSKNKIGLNIKVKNYVEDNTCTFSWTADSDHQGYAGIVHGGIICTILDEAIAHAVMGSEPKNYVVTADFKIKFYRPTPVGIPLKIVATLVDKRRNILFGQGTILLSDGTVLAEAKSRFAEITIPGAKE